MIFICVCGLENVVEQAWLIVQFNEPADSFIEPLCFICSGVLFSELTCIRVDVPFSDTFKIKRES